MIVIKRREEKRKEKTVQGKHKMIVWVLKEAASICCGINVIEQRLQNFV